MDSISRKNKNVLASGALINCHDYKLTKRFLKYKKRSSRFPSEMKRASVGLRSARSDSASAITSPVVVSPGIQQLPPDVTQGQLLPFLSLSDLGAWRSTSKQRRQLLPSSRDAGGRGATECNWKTQKGQKCLLDSDPVVGCETWCLNNLAARVLAQAKATLKAGGEDEDVQIQLATSGSSAARPFATLKLVSLPRTMQGEVPTNEVALLQNDLQAEVGEKQRYAQLLEKLRDISDRFLLLQYGLPSVRVVDLEESDIADVLHLLLPYSRRVTIVKDQAEQQPLRGSVTVADWVRRKARVSDPNANANANSIYLPR